MFIYKFKTILVKIPTCFFFLERVIKDDFKTYKERQGGSSKKSEGEKDKQCKVFIIKIVRDAWKHKQMNGSD